MAKMKQLAIDLAEYEDEIKEVLETISKDAPHVFTLIMNKGVADTAKMTCIRNFTDNEHLAKLILFKINA